MDSITAKIMELCRKAITKKLTPYISAPNYCIPMNLPL